MDNPSELSRPPSSGYSSQPQNPSPSEVPSSGYAPRQISSPPGLGQPQPQATSAYPQSSSPPFTAPNTNTNNAAYRPGSSGGAQPGGNITGAAPQRQYQPMAGQPAPQTTVPQNPQPQSGGAPLLRRMDSRSSMSPAGSVGGGSGGGSVPPTGQQQSQLTRPQQPGQQPMPQNLMQRPQGQPQNPQQQMFRPPAPQPGQRPPNFQPQQQQPLQRPPMMMRPQQMGPNGQPMPPQMRPQFPGPRPLPGPNPNQPNLRPTMQNPGQFQPRFPDDQKALDSLRPSSRNGKLSAYDDDDDVVIGRAVTPNYAQRPGQGNNSGQSLGANGMRDPQLLSRQPSQQGSISNQQLPFQMQHANSKGSIPSRPPSRPQSRPPSGPDHPSSPSPDGMMKPGVNFMEPSEMNKAGLNLRPIPEMGRDNAMGVGQQFRIGQMVNKPMVPNANFQSSSVNLNAILNVDRSRPLSRELPPSTSPMDNGKKEFDVSGLKGDNDSGVDESTQGTERNGPPSPNSPQKSPSKIPGLTRPTSSATVTTTSSSNSSSNLSKSRSSSKARLLAKTPETPIEPKKVPMNKVQVGATPSPNLKAVRSKIGSLENQTHKPGGGNVKIESRKVEVKAAPRIAARNDMYVPGGGDKKIQTHKVEIKAQSKIGSLENAGHKPRGGDKKIETVKLDFKERSRSKVGSKDHIGHVPGGGDVKIQTHKVEVRAQSKIGSLGNVHHKPGGGDKKIFDDKEYLRNVEHPIAPNMSSNQTDEGDGEESTITPSATTTSTTEAGEQ